MKNIHDMYQIRCTKAAATRYLRNEGAFYAADTPLFCGGGSRMHFVDSSNRWRCNGIVQQNGRQCCSGTSRAATLDSFFYHRHIACNNVLLILYFWAIKTPRMTISQAVGIHQQYTSGVINDWHQMIYCDLSENDTKIGGPGIIVEIDESKFGKRKYHRGHRVEGVWVVGGIERTDERKCFLITVPNRTALTLEAIIREHVLPGSIVYTDCWRAYSRIPDIVSDSQHRTVNHSREYITVDGVHTNTIEGTWAGVKCNIAVRLRNRKMMPWMLVEFIWRRKHYGDIWGGIMKCMSEVEFHRHDDFTPYLTEFRNDADSEEDE